jgi:hypothetical protein
MTSKSKQKKWTAAQVKEHIRNIGKAIEKHKNENKGEHFTSVTPEEIERKLKRVNSPMIVSQAWGDTTPGGTLGYGFGIYNPDATVAGSLYAHVWVGSGNIDPTVGTYLLNVDTRFPRLTQPKAFALTLDPGAWSTLHFDIKVPSSVEKTNYIGNSCLMQFDWHDVGTYLDRSVFVFEVK